MPTTTRRPSLAAATTAVRLSIAALAVGGAACTGQITGESVVAKPTLRQPAALGDLVEIHVLPDALELRYDGVAPAFAAGDVVWGTEGTGYLRKVTAVSAEGASLRLATTMADVGDGFDQIVVDQAGSPVVPPAPPLPVAQDLHVTMVGSDGITYDAHVRYAQPTFTSSPQATGAVFDWEIPELSIEITDPTGAAHLTLAARSLRIEKQLDFDVGLDWSWGTLHDLRFIVDDHSTYALDQLSIAVDGAVPLFDQSIPLFDDPALVTVPAGPFVFTLGGSLGLGLDAVLSAAGELHTTSAVSLATHDKHGVTWDGRFHPIDERAATVDADFGSLALGQARASLSADVSIAGTLRFALWGVIGPELHGQVTPVAADLTATPAGWQLALAANASGGLRFVLPFVKPDAFDVELGSWDQTYYQTSGAW